MSTKINVYRLLGGDTLMTNSEKQKALRDRRRAAGLKRCDVWAKPEHHAKIQNFAKTLENNMNKTQDQNKTQETQETEEFRFENGSLYKLKNGSYIHVFRNARCKTKAAAIDAYHASEYDEE
jgi:hypothetical protein